MAKRIVVTLIGLIVLAELSGITVIRGTVWWLSLFVPGFAYISW